MELRDYLRILRAHWLGVLLITILTIGAASAYTFTRVPVYAADASGFVAIGGSENPALGSLNDQLAKSRATSYVDIAKSRATAQEVNRLLNLDQDPAGLVGRIDVVQPPDTVLLKITARAGSPKDAQELANAWVAALAEQVQSIEDPQNKNANKVPHIVPVESAALPTRPVSPRPERNLALALVLGLMLGFGYAMVRNVLDRRLRTADLVEQRFPVSVVGMVPVSDLLEHKKGERAKLALQGRTEASDDAASGEAFRKLRTNLAFMDVDNPPRVIVVTSPRPGDGKSTVSANLAAAVAAGGQSVVLIDADLRRPSVADSLGLVEGVGLTDVLTGRVDAIDALQEVSGREHMRVMAAGRIPPNPSELLGSNAMRSLVAELGEKYLVILDAPPLLPVTDAALLTANADGALVVISAGRTVDAELNTALNHLTAVRGRALGVIMNKVPRRGAGAYGGYYGYYSDDYTSRRSLTQRSGWRSLFRRSSTPRAERAKLEALAKDREADGDGPGDS
ncbi:polysaccharide biosynthesis tyrosine autokinase [Nocardioides marmoribigeumensis]|uniref:Capsular exopolysaccharide synthesis family protein n=1 Tax=Nocardioides marmoribigeumensis TaxID=433649 RepID=A0ABU2BTP3_9ACTN|nr:polysaccharide biosynthesis tyrosine autokinase [Nocardioides marmoribigeumensis]MDR7362002.1 capsular exopolysaccharide synthesis family protein [Nocardioides marmoribigeumensis]